MDRKLISVFFYNLPDYQSIKLKRFDVFFSHLIKSIYAAFFYTLSHQTLLILCLLSLFPSLVLGNSSIEKISLQLPWKYQFEFAGYIAAKEKGFYTEAGLDVEIKELANNKQDVISEVLSGNSDYGVFDNDLIQTAIKNKLPAVLLASYFKRSALVLVSNEPIFRPDKLINKRIMATQSQINSGAINLLLKRLNIDPESLTIVPHSFDINDFINGNVDISTVYLSNEIYELQRRNIPFNIIDPNMYGIYSNNNNLFTSQKNVKQFYSRNQRLIDASNKGWQYALKHPEEIARIIYDKYSQHKSIDALDFEARTIKNLILAQFYPLGSYDKTQISKNIEMLSSYGLIDGDYTLSGLFFEDYKKTTLNLTSDEINFLKHHPTISFSNELDWYPYDFSDNGEKNGQAMGYSIDYLNMLADKIGVQLRFESNNWHILIQKIKNHEIDALHVVTKNKQRESYLSFTKPYLNIRHSIISLDSPGNSILSLRDLDGKILALGKNWGMTTYIRENYPNIKLLEVNNSRQMLDAITFGQADAAIDDYQTASYLARELFISNLKITPITKSLQIDTNLRIAFHNDLTPLANIFEKAMDAVSIDDLHHLRKKWFTHQNTINNTTSPGIQFSPQELAYLNQKSSLNVCIDPDWMPLEKLEHGKHIGMTAEYFKLFKRLIPVPVRVVQTSSWIESIKQAKARNCDLFSLAMITKERQKYMNFTIPYLKIPLVIATQNKELFIPDISLITEQKLGIVRGYAFGEILRNKYPEMDIIDVDSVSSGLELVNNGELFGFIGTLATVSFAIQKEFTGELKIAGKFDDSWELGIATRNDEPLLNTIFNKAINTISPEEHQKILNQWVSVRYEKGADYQKIMLWFLALTIIGLFVSYRNYTLHRYNIKLQKIAQTDKLTQLHNRQKIDQDLSHQKALCNRYEQNFSIILIDIDYFKEINDVYGHLTGDSVLVEFSLLLKDNVRNVDILGRWGGEEFLIICPNSTLDAVKILAEKLRLKIEKYNFNNVATKITACFGIAQFNLKDNSVQQLIHVADKALYQAKLNGRNQVICTPLTSSSCDVSSADKAFHNYKD